MKSIILRIIMAIGLSVGVLSIISVYASVQSSFQIAIEGPATANNSDPFTYGVKFSNVQNEFSSADYAITFPSDLTNITLSCRVTSGLAQCPSTLPTPKLSTDKTTTTIQGNMSVFPAGSMVEFTINGNYILVPKTSISMVATLSANGSKKSSQINTTLTTLPVDLSTTIASDHDGKPWLIGDTLNYVATYTNKGPGIADEANVVMAFYKPPNMEYSDLEVTCTGYNGAVCPNPIGTRFSGASKTQRFYFISGGDSINYEWIGGGNTNLGYIGGGSAAVYTVSSWGAKPYVINIPSWPIGGSIVMKVSMKVKNYPDMIACNTTGKYTIPAITAKSYVLPKEVLESFTEANYGTTTVFRQQFVEMNMADNIAFTPGKTVDYSCTDLTITSESIPNYPPPGTTVDIITTINNGGPGVSSGASFTIDLPNIINYSNLASPTCVTTNPSGCPIETGYDLFTKKFYGKLNAGFVPNQPILYTFRGVLGATIPANPTQTVSTTIAATDPLEFERNIASNSSTNNFTIKQNTTEYTKASSTKSPQPGDVVQYSITVKNPSDNTPLEDFSIQDTLPGGMTYLNSTADPPASGSPTLNSTNPEWEWIGRKLLPGTTLTLNFQAKLPNDLSICGKRIDNSFSFSNSGKLLGFWTNPTAYNGTLGSNSGDDITVECIPHIHVGVSGTMTATGGEVYTGKISVTNDSNFDYLTGFTITGKWTQKLSSIFSGSYNIGDGGCSITDDSFSCLVGEGLASGQIKEINIMGSLQYALNGNVTLTVSPGTDPDKTSCSPVDCALSTEVTGLIWNGKVLIIGQALGNNIGDIEQIPGRITEKLETPLFTNIINSIRKNFAISTRNVDINTRHQLGNTLVYGSSSNRLKIDSSMFSQGGNTIRTIATYGRDIQIDTAIPKGLAPKAIIALKDSSGKGGNIYLSGGISNIGSSIIAEGSIFSLDPESRYQLIIQGTVISRNVIASEDCPPLISTPCLIDGKNPYDMGKWRKYMYQVDSLYIANSNWLTSPPLPYYQKAPLIIEFDANILSDPPPILDL